MGLIALAAAVAVDLFLGTVLSFLLVVGDLVMAKLLIARLPFNRFPACPIDAKYVRNTLEWGQSTRGWPHVNVIVRYYAITFYVIHHICVVIEKHETNTISALISAPRFWTATTIPAVV